MIQRIKIFFKWFPDVVFKHNYWYKQPSAMWGTENWGKAIQIPNTPLSVKTFGDPVTRKVCDVCGVIVWSNNKQSICGHLHCWISKYYRVNGGRHVRINRRRFEGNSAK